MAVVILATLTTACGVTITRTNSIASGPHTITYRGTNTYNAPSQVVQYTDGDGNTQYLATTGATWERSFTLNSGKHVTFVVSSSNDLGAVKCEILVDGAAWKSQQSPDGGYQEAKCSGTVPG